MHPPTRLLYVSVIAVLGLALFTGTRKARSQTPVRWEYCQLSLLKDYDPAPHNLRYVLTRPDGKQTAAPLGDTIPTELAEKEHVRILNGLGAEGWEITRSTGDTIILRRRK